MTRIVLKIDGMGCGMCEAHVNDAVRAAFAPKKVTSSHKKGETVILACEPLCEELLRRTVEKAGYRVESVTQEAYEKKGLFGKVK